MFIAGTGVKVNAGDYFRRGCGISRGAPRSQAVEVQAATMTLTNRGEKPSEALNAVI
jgi:hypothetical protein